MSSKPYRVIAEIKVVNEDGEIVDHRGYLPRKGVGAQSCTVTVSEHDDVMEANKSMNAYYAVVDVIQDLRNIR